MHNERQTNVARQVKQLVRAGCAQVLASHEVLIAERRFGHELSANKLT